MTGLSHGRLKRMLQCSGRNQSTSASAAPEPSGPSLFTALKEWLGLELRPGKGPVDALVIDPMEKPAEDWPQDFH